MRRFEDREVQFKNYVIHLTCVATCVFDRIISVQSLCGDYEIELGFYSAKIIKLCILETWGKSKNEIRFEY